MREKQTEKLEKKIGGIQIRSIEETPTRVRTGFMYWINEGEIILDVGCPIDLEKTKRNCGIHFGKTANMPEPEYLVCSCMYKGKYNHPVLKEFVKEIKKSYNKELK